MSNKAKIWLYKEGNECTTISGGWDITATNLTECVVGSITKNENSISFYNTTRQISNIYCKNTFNYKCGYVVNAEINISNTSNFSCSLLVHSNYREGSAENGTYTRFPMTVGRHSVTYTVPSDRNYYTVIHTPYYNGEITRIWIDCLEDVISLNYVDYDNLNISLNNINGLITFNQVDILANGRIIQSYTENLDSITYTFDNSLMDWGNNEISIRAIYTQGDNIYEIAELISDTLYVREVILEEFEPVGHLPSNANMRDIVNRISLIGSANNAIKNNLKNLLESKGFEVGDATRLSSMVKLVNELSNNNSTEITKYINRITELESEVANNKILLYNKLIDIGINCSQDTNFADLVNKLDEISTKSVDLYLNGEDLVGFNTAFNNGYNSDVLVKYTNYMQSSNPNTNSWIARSTEAVVSTVGMNYLYIEYELAVSPSLNLDNAVDLYPVKPTSWSGLVNGAKSLFYRVTAGQTTGIYSAFVDIRDINGTYSVCVRTSWGGVRIRKIWMSK